MGKLPIPRMPPEKGNSECILSAFLSANRGFSRVIHGPGSPEITHTQSSSISFSNVYLQQYLQHSGSITCRSDLQAGRYNWLYNSHIYTYTGPIRSHIASSLSCISTAESSWLSFNTPDHYGFSFIHSILLRPVIFLDNLVLLSILTLKLGWFWAYRKSAL